MTRILARYLSRSATKSCVLCLMSFYLLIFRVFTKDVLLNAKIFSICFVAKFFILAFIKTPSAKTQKKVNKKTQNTKHKTQLVDERDIYLTQSIVLGTIHK